MMQNSPDGRGNAAARQATECASAGGSTLGETTALDTRSDCMVVALERTAGRAVREGIMFRSKK